MMFKNATALRRPAIVALLTMLSISFLIGCSGGEKASNSPNSETATAQTENKNDSPQVIDEAATEDESVEQAEEVRTAKLSDYVKPSILDEWNPDVPEGMRGKAEPIRGGVLRVRSPSDFQELNPMTSTGQPEALVERLIFDDLVKQDFDTLEYFPWTAWAFEKADLMKTKGGEVQEGIFLELGEENDSNSEVAFVPGAKRYTFSKYDLAAVDVEGGSLTLKDKWGGATYHGKINTMPTTYEVNTGYDPANKNNVVRVKMGDLDTWRDRVGGEITDRPYRKQECAFYFHIRPGVTWQDGEPLTGEDVKFSYEIAMNLNVNAQHIRNYLEDVTMCEVQNDGTTVHFQARKPYFNQFAALVGILPVLPRHVFNPDQYGGDEKALGDAFNSHPFRTKPLGTGPFKLVSWDQGSSLVLERNDNFWGSQLPAESLHKWEPNQPYMDRIIFAIIMEKTASLKELQKGSIDADMDIEPDQWFLDETNTDDFKERIVRAKRYGFLYTYVGWNCARPLFEDKDVRMALNMLIPRQKIATDIHKGLAELVTGPFYSRGPGYDPNVPQVPYDPEKAKRMLRRAGWLDRDEDGVIEKEIDGEMVPFEFQYMIHSARDYHQKVADIVKEHIEQAGIKVTIKRLDWTVFSEEVREKNFDAVRFAWGTALDPDPYQIWHSSQIKNKGDNFVSFQNDEADHLMVQMRETFDPIERWEMARKIHRLVAEDQPVCFLYGFYETYFYNRGLQGVKLYPSTYPYDFREWWWADADRRSQN
ncbi:hypothetical protein KQI84_18080 [bacterium]|nr:hypothetical protein [bacterium]